MVFSLAKGQNISLTFAGLPDSFVPDSLSVIKKSRCMNDFIDANKDETYLPDCFQMFCGTNRYHLKIYVLRL